MNIQKYKADISVRRVGIITAPKLPPDHPSVRFSSCLTREIFPAADITEARQRAIARVENPNTPEFLKCLDFYSFRSKRLTGKTGKSQENRKAAEKRASATKWQMVTVLRTDEGMRNTPAFPVKHKSIPAKANPFSTSGFQVDCQNPCLRS